MLTYIFLILGFVFLKKGADFLVDGASSIAHSLKVSDLVIGLTIVAFGTSCPELFVNIVASIEGSNGIAIGNVIGSNITNVFLILGLCALIKPLSVGRGTAWREIPFCLLAASLVVVLAGYGGIAGRTGFELGKIDGLAFLVLFIFFLVYSFRIAHTGFDEDAVPQKEYAVPMAAFLIILGLLGLGFGSRWIVSSGVQIARSFGVSETLIGLTVVAFGTCLPELATSIVAVRRGKVELAVGNIVGSFIFNIFLVLGVSALIRPILFDPRHFIDAGVAVLAALLLFITMFTGKHRVLDRWEGILFLVLYSGYISFVIVQR